MKKYTTTLLFAALTLFSWAADKPNIVATTTIIADITYQIAGDKVTITSLVPVGGDPHLYEPIPQDAIVISKADLILKNGLTLEGWLNEFIENSGTKAAVATVTEGIEPIQSSTYANSPDPHAWMDAENGIIYAENIKNALVKLDADHAAEYETAFEKYKESLVETENIIKNLIDSIPADKRILITSHDAFQYYGRKYGLQLESILGTSTDAEAQTSDINRLYSVIKKSGIPAIFIESTINPQTIQQIAKDTKVKIGGKLYADSLGDPESEGGTYTGMLITNTRNIANALRGIVNENDEKATSSKDSSSSNWIFVGIIAIILVGGAGFMFKKMSA
jgi:ABC-type Zn uptake system ZnuABC Zn-binding protein ZnuA